MKRVGFVTYRELPRFTDDDKLAVEALRGIGIGVEPLVWEDPAVDWGEYDALVLRSCWDYHRRSREFAAWVEQLRSSGANLWNQPETVLWNMDKSYLADLEKSGVLVPRTVFIPGGKSTDLASALQEAGFSEAVLKPTVSATAWQTIRTSTRAAAADQAHLGAILQRSGALLQEYVTEIAEVGEWSLIFLGGRFSHGVLKVPMPGEFRVQADFGGGVQHHAPPDSLVEQAAGILEVVKSLCRERAESAGRALRIAEPAGSGPIADRAGRELLYARVDGVERQGKLILMELEAIEPELFFRADAAAPGRFAAALQALCLRERD